MFVEAESVASASFSVSKHQNKMISMIANNPDVYNTYLSDQTGSNLSEYTTSMVEI